MTTYRDSAEDPEEVLVVSRNIPNALSFHGGVVVGRSYPGMSVYTMWHRIQELR